MLDQQYSPAKTIVKGIAPFLIPIISEATAATAASAGFEINKTVTYSCVTFVFGAIVSLKNWFKNRRK